MTHVDWAMLGFIPAALNEPQSPLEADADLSHANYMVPPGMLGFGVLKENAKDIVEVIGDWSPHLMLTVRISGRETYFLRTDAPLDRCDMASLPATVSLLQPGDLVPLPLESERSIPASQDTISFVPMEEIKQKFEPPPPPPPPEPEISLSNYSVRGSAEKFEREVVEATALLGSVCLAGQFTLWYAPPNAGKTLIMLKLLAEAILAKRINPGRVYYFGADDNSAGLAEKVRLLDDLGVHSLVPGHKGLTPAKLLEELRLLAQRDQARGVVILLDTVKKLTSLMDKAKASEFAEVCRRFVMKGGTIVGLAHTNKNLGADGKLRFAGTSDLVDDCDAAYIITPRKLDDGSGECVAEFNAHKRRGNSAEHVAYAYAGDGSISYAERLASVRLLETGQLDEFKRVEVERSDADVIAAVTACISEGVTAKMALAKATALRAVTSERRAIQVIERYTGNDPVMHRWTYTVRERGAKVFALLPAPASDPAPETPPSA